MQKNQAQQSLEFVVVESEPQEQGYCTYINRRSSAGCVHMARENESPSIDDGSSGCTKLHDHAKISSATIITNTIANRVRETITNQ
jgi:hypothetical protein